MDDHRRKLRFRAWRRGFREMDLIMGQFADAHIASMSADELCDFEKLLAVPDWDVYAWILGRQTVPDNHASSVLDRLIAFRYDAGSQP